MKVIFKQKGDFTKASSWLERLKGGVHFSILDKYGKLGVEALSAATPKDTGYTAASWDYEIVRDSENETARLIFTNSSQNKGFPIAVLLQYGHGTGTGGWVEGIDYINPALKPIFEELVEKIVKEVRET